MPAFHSRVVWERGNLAAITPQECGAPTQSSRYTKKVAAWCPGAARVVRLPSFHSARAMHLFKLRDSVWKLLCCYTRVHNAGDAKMGLAVVKTC